MRDRSPTAPSPNALWEPILTGTRSPALRYLFAVVVSCLSLGMVILFQKLEPGAPFTSFAILSVILSAIFGDRGPAFVDTLITSIGIDYFFSEPSYEVLDSVSSFARVLVYMAIGYIVSALVESLKENFVAIRRQKEELALEKEARENVLGVVSHDLRTPLASIIMNTDLVLRAVNACALPPTTPRLLSNVRGSAQRMNRLIEDLLDAIKVDAGSFAVDRKRLDVSEILAVSVEESTPAALQKNLRLILRSDPPPTFVAADASRLIQVFNNLIGNAVKFSPPESVVTVTLASTEGEVVIGVRDLGPGISREDQAHLFERYWQGKSTAHKGTGLGLYISKCIVDLHGGSLDVSSTLGEGATFLVRLPLLAADRAQETVQSPAFH